MTKMIKKISAIAVLLSVSVLGFCNDNDQKGTSTAVFLKMIPGARPAALGNAFTGISDDINALYTNASGLASLVNIEVSATHIKWFEDINNTFISAVYPFKNNAIGLGINYLSFGEIDFRDAAGAKLKNESAYNASVSFAFSRKLSERFMSGLTVKNIIQRLGAYDGNGYAFDVSVLSKFGSVSAGASAQNLGSKIAIAGVDNDLPFTVKAGIGWVPDMPILERKLLLGFDVESPRDDNIKIHAGAEYALQQQLILRAGYNQVNGGFDKIGTGGKNGGLTAGIGSKTFLGQKSIYGSEETDTENLTELIFDYALAQFSEDLGYAHRITISVKFK